MIPTVYHSFRQSASRLEGLLETFFTQHSRLVYWVPVFLGCGIEVYFSLTFEPSYIPLLVGSFLLTGAALALRRVRLAYFILFILTCFSWGVSLPCVRTSLLNTPLLVEELAPQWIEGQVEQLEAFPTYQRITLYHPRLKHPFSEDALTKVRLSMWGRLVLPDFIVPGDWIAVKGILMPPVEPAVPRSFNFRRQAYFDRISAVGYGILPARLLHPGDQTWWRRVKTHIESLRHTLNQHFVKTLKAPESALAKALVTGERSAIPEEVRLAFAASGTAHLLAISGLHLSVVAGFMFVFLRFLLAAIPALSLRYHIKKWAAFLALGAVFFYWLICGGSFPATRALVMCTLILGAVMIDRTAITLRNVALAASLILILIPEALESPSFQLSFAAVVALVAMYEHFKIPFLKTSSRTGGALVKGFLYFMGVISTTFIATVATTPFLAATFHNLTLQAIPANLLAVPWTTFVVIPLLIGSLVTLPLGYDFGLSSVLEVALTWMREIAETVADWPGSMVPIPEPAPGVMSLLTLSCLWICLVKGRLRLVGLAPLSLSLVWWTFFSPVPDLFLSHDAKVIGVRTEKDLWVVSKRSGAFARKVWAQASALEAPQKLSMTGVPGATRSGDTLTLLPPYILDLTPVALSNQTTGEVFLSQQQLSVWGSTLVWLRPSGPRFTSVRKDQGTRPWSLYNPK